MKISRNWLLDYVDIKGLPIDEVAERFTMSTAEIEGVEKVGDRWPGVLTAKIVSIEPHPDAEKLRLPTVSIGSETMKLVCGAPNIEVGQVVPLARIGCELPGGFKLKKAKIRGVESEGMLCSEKELGLSEESHGILILPPETSIGIPLSQALGLEDDIFLIDNKSITHRPDLWGHYGVAREIAAVFKRPLAPMDPKMPEKEGTNLAIADEDPSLCPRYSAMLFKNIAITASPEWIRNRLEAAGCRAINNVVDATNYVLYELGQPLHSFDRKKINGDKIVIRKAREGEKFTTLDGMERALLPSDIVIADEKRAVALGGVMGGLNTEVDEHTTEILLESANFHPATIRRTANRLALRTDAAIRYEKSLDPAMTTTAIKRFYEILKLSCPDVEVEGKIADFWPAPPAKVSINIRPSFINRRLGTKLSIEQMQGILENLDFRVSEEAADQWKVEVPSYRATKDIAIPEDLVEEIGRIFGYDNIEPLAPTVAIFPPFQEPLDILSKKLKNILSLQGGSAEVYCYSFNGEEAVRKLGMDPAKNLKLRNPLNNEQNLMRRSLLPNLLKVAEENFKRLDRFALYELGTLFLSEDHSKLPEERLSLCALSAGRKSPNGELFFEAKGLCELIMEELRLTDVRYESDPESLETWMHPGRTAFIRQGEKTLGVITELHPRVADSFALGGALGVLSIDVGLLEEANKLKDAFESVPVFPPVSFDVSVLVDARTSVSEVEKVLRQAERKLLKEVKLFDVYAGKNLPEGKKSLAFNLLFASKERTLEAKEVERLQKRVTDALERGGYSLRSAK